METNMACPQMICFDWDGTLIDSFDKIASCIFTTAKQMGLKKATKPSIKTKIGLPFEQLIEELYGSVCPKDFIDQYHKVYDAMPVPKLFPNCVHMLNTLRNHGILVVMVTNKSRRSAEAELIGHGILELFDSIWVAEELAAKPSPLMLHHAMTSHQATPEQVWMVGDSSADLHAAYNAGCKAVLCDDVKIPPWIENVEHIDDLAEILKLVGDKIYQ